MYSLLYTNKDNKIVEKKVAKGISKSEEEAVEEEMFTQIKII